MKTENDEVLLSRIKVAGEQGYKQREILEALNIGRKRFRKMLSKNNLINTFSISPKQLVDKRPLEEIFKLEAEDTHK